MFSIQVKLSLGPPFLCSLIQHSQERCPFGPFQVPSQKKWEIDFRQAELVKRDFLDICPWNSISAPSSRHGGRITRYFFSPKNCNCVFPRLIRFNGKLEETNRMAVVLVDRKNWRRGKYKSIFIIQNAQKTKFHLLHF